MYPKEGGGLGLRLTELSNRAMHAKLSWQVASKEKRLWVQHLERKYCRRYSFMNVQPANLDSPQWKEILKGRHIIKKGRCFMVGDGESISVWNDPCISTLPDYLPVPRDLYNITIYKVSELMRNEEWDEVIIRKHFDHDITREILSIKIYPTEMEDKCI